MRLSPYGVFNGTGAYPDLEAQYFVLADELSTLGLIYLHVLDHSAMGAPPVPAEFKSALRRRFKGPFILAGGFDHASAETALNEDRADLIAFGRPFLANPDLVLRMHDDGPLNERIRPLFMCRDRRVIRTIRLCRDEWSSTENLVIVSIRPGTLDWHRVPGLEFECVVKL